ncbi:breast carcinoma-amplified sequence 4 isoform X4 [Rousettus aegyptiacus]|uniref:breast carcinoma-amplified sequence 4 isoform X4 n=1 Tax=Rousettus aegyptiacus TaxID=9407 RepID=UPI00168D471F|nr:breast carcinoma-amplified sequence 4 isoform X4 [Rousettus aegyptiacus]
MQPAGGGTPGPRSCDGLPRSVRQLDPAALLMLLVDADRPEPVRSGARELALFLTPEPGAEAKEVEETIEGMLLRLEEFCSLTDMIRSDTSQILEENIPLLKAKVTEMRGIYTRVDQLEAFVKMVGRHVSFLEDHVLRAERDHGAFSQALRRWLGSAGLPRFRTGELFVGAFVGTPQPLAGRRDTPNVPSPEHPNTATVRGIAMTAASLDQVLPSLDPVVFVPAGSSDRRTLPAPCLS